MLNKLALGTAQLGSNYGITNKTGMPSQDSANLIIRIAISSGIKSIDTARVYGTSEEAIGKAVAGIDTAGVIISTKLSPYILENTKSQQDIHNNVDKSIHESLEALGTNSLDVLMLHRWSHFNNEGVRNRLLHWKNEAVIKKLGASVTNPHEALEALAQPDIGFIQIPFNILDWRFRRKNFKIAAMQNPNVTIQARSAFLQGILISPAKIWPKDSNAEGIINHLEQLVVDFGRQNRADLCLAYLRSVDFITNIVIGMETIQQLESNIELFHQPLLNEEQIQIIEKTFATTPETLLNPSLWK